MIEGHTDDVPVIAGSPYKDNWDLSVLQGYLHCENIAGRFLD